MAKRVTPEMLLEQRLGNVVRQALRVHGHGPDSPAHDIGVAVALGVLAALDEARRELGWTEPANDAAATHSELPGALLRQLAEAWTARRRVSFAQGLYAAQATESSGQLTGIVEQHVVGRLDEQLRNQGLQLLTSTGPVWTRWPGQPAAGFSAVEQIVSQPPLTQQPREMPWKAGDPADDYDVLICRITGDSIPLLRH